ACRAQGPRRVADARAVQRRGARRLRNPEGVARRRAGARAAAPRLARADAAGDARRPIPALDQGFPRRRVTLGNQKAPMPGVSRRSTSFHSWTRPRLELWMAGTSLAMGLLKEDPCVRSR